jgi:hypothetical protein
LRSRTVTRVTIDRATTKTIKNQVLALRPEVTVETVNPTPVTILIAVERRRVTVSIIPLAIRASTVTA